MRLIVYGLILVFLTACGESEQTAGGTATAVDQPLTQKTRIGRFEHLKNDSSLTTYDAERMLNQFSAACPTFAKAATELTDLHLTGGNSVQGMHRLRGWTHKYQLTFQVPDQPVNSDLREAHAMSNVCYFQFGGGENPGFDSGKTACARICGQASTDFVSISEMAWLDDPSSNAYRSRKAQLEQKYQADISELTQKAERGDYQAQRNLAYIYANDSFSRSDRILGCTWRIAISSYNPKAINLDIDNIKMDCGQLTDSEKQKAMTNLIIVEDVLKSHKKQ